MNDLYFLIPIFALMIFSALCWSRIIDDFISALRGRSTPRFTREEIDAKEAEARGRIQKYGGVVKCSDFNNLTEKSIMVIEENGELYCRALYGRTIGVAHKLPRQGNVASIKFLDRDQFVVVFRDEGDKIDGVRALLTGFTITYLSHDPN